MKKKNRPLNNFSTEIKRFPCGFHFVPSKSNVYCHRVYSDHKIWLLVCGLKSPSRYITPEGHGDGSRSAGAGVAFNRSLLFNNRFRYCNHTTITAKNKK